MSDAAASRLRQFGFLALLLALLALIVLVSTRGELEKIDVGAMILAMLAAGFGLLLISEVGPSLASIKAGDIEATFVSTAGDKFLKLEERVAKLELHATATSPLEKTAAASGQSVDPPAFQRPKTVSDDQWKGRFGGKARVGDFRLRSEFRHASARFVEIVMIVDHLGSDSIPQGTTAQFYLHETFDTAMVPAQFAEGTASVSVIAYGGFTVGVWLPLQQIELELDLSQVTGAPRIVREL
jgi:hypothetical protein